MSPTVNVLHCMVYNLMRVVSGKPFIGEQRIGIEGSASLYMLANFGL